MVLDLLPEGSGYITFRIAGEGVLGNLQDGENFLIGNAGVRLCKQGIQVGHTTMAQYVGAIHFEGRVQLVGNVTRFNDYHETSTERGRGQGAKVWYAVTCFFLQSAEGE